MLKVDLHLHTADDPCDRIPYTTDDAIDRAAELGFAAIAITLHDRQLDLRPFTAHAQERGILLIPGVERTISSRHVLLVNFPDSAERVRNFDDVAALKDRYRDGLVIAPHPFFPLSNCLRELAVEHEELFDAVEFNGCYTRHVNFNRRAVRWARSCGRPLVGNSDAHRIQLLGRTYSSVDAEPEPAAICAALRAGRVEVRSQPLSTVALAAYLAGLTRGVRKTQDGRPLRVR